MPRDSGKYRLLITLGLIVVGLVFGLLVMFNTRMESSRKGSGPTQSSGSMMLQVDQATVVLDLSWTGAPDSVGYTLYYGPNPASQSCINKGNCYPNSIPVTGTSVTLMLPEGVWFLAVKGKSVDGIESFASNEISYTALPLSSPSPTASPSPSPTPVRTPTPSPSPPRTPTPTPAPNGPAITSVSLVRNSPGGQVIMPLVNGTVINLSTLPTQNVNVQALAAASAVKLVFSLTTGGGLYIHTENTAPYALCGDWDPCPTNSLTGLGSHVLQVQAFNASGVGGATFIATFSVVSPTPRPTPHVVGTITPRPEVTPNPVARGTPNVSGSAPR